MNLLERQNVFFLIDLSDKFIVKYLKPVKSIKNRAILTGISGFRVLLQFYQFFLQKAQDGRQIGSKFEESCEVLDQKKTRFRRH